MVVWVVLRHLQQTERNLYTIQKESICCVCKVYILFSFSIYQMLPNGNVIHQERSQIDNTQGVGKMGTKNRDT
jgi:hypothetical protein